MSAIARCLGGALTVAACVGLLGACGSAGAPVTQPGAAIRALQHESRQIGRGARFESVVTGPVIEPCRRGLGARSEVHIELFAENRVVLIPAGIGVRGPVTRSAGRIVTARCFGHLVTLDPTGVVLVASGTAGPPATLATLFKSWGEPLSARRLAGFRGPAHGRVRVYVDGRRRFGPPGALVLRTHAEVVLEVGAYVEPHRRYAFPSGL